MVLRPDATSNQIHDVFQSNCTHILRSQLLLALTDEPDTGMHWEMGYAHAKNIPCVVVSFASKPVNVMLVQSCIGFIQNEQQLTNFLKGIIVNDEKDYAWEGLSTWKSIGRPVF